MSGGYRVERIIRQMVDGGDFKATLTHKLEGGLLEFVLTSKDGSAITEMEPDEVRDLHRALERYLKDEGPQG